jgi:L-asparaginase
MSEKISLIGFGGTIGMVPDAEGTLVPAKSAADLVEQSPGLTKLGANLEVIQLVDKDSTDLVVEDWQLLIRKIAELHNSSDGIIVTHGTDTMPYTSTATALAFGDQLAIPVVFTGAQLPIDAVGTDARSNLERSMKVVLEAGRDNISEVMIVFSDRVLRAARAIKTSESRFDAFDSPGFPHLADITASDSIFSPLIRRSFSFGLGLSPKIQDQFDTRIASIDVKPGLEPDVVRSLAASQKCGALILKSLGSGSVPSHGEFSLVPVIQEVVESGKPVIIATKFVGGRATPQKYTPGRDALRAGAGHAGNMTDVATEVKLMWLMGQDIHEPEQVNEAMLRPFVGELD